MKNSLIAWVLNLLILICVLIIFFLIIGSAGVLGPGEFSIENIQATNTAYFYRALVCVLICFIMVLIHRKVFTALTIAKKIDFYILFFFLLYSISIISIEHYMFGKFCEALKTI